MKRLLLLSAVALAACGGGQKVKDQPVGDPANLDAPTAEALAQSPCGQPDWSELPAGSDAPEPEQAEAPPQ